MPVNTAVTACIYGHLAYLYIQELTPALIPQNCFPPNTPGVSVVKLYGLHDPKRNGPPVRLWMALAHAEVSENRKSRNVEPSTRL